MANWLRGGTFSALIYARHCEAISDEAVYVELRNDKPHPPDNVRIIEVLHAKKEETELQFRERVIDFLQHATL